MMIKVRDDFLSIAKLLSTNADKIRFELVKEIADILAPGLKKYNVLWNAGTFRKALLDGDVPQELLEKLDRILKTAVTMNWDIPASVVEELDCIVEDIESFNPAFRKSLGSKPKSNGRSSSSKLKSERK